MTVQWYREALRNSKVLPRPPDKAMDVRMPDVFNTILALLSLSGSQQNIQAANH